MSRFDKLVTLYARFIVFFRWPVLFVMLGFIYFVGQGALNIGFTSDYRYFFDAQNPHFLAFDKLERTYTSPDSLLWVIQSSEVKATDARVLSVVHKLTENAWRTPYAIRVDSLTNFQHTRAEEDDLIVSDLVPDPSIVDAARSAEIERIVLDDPIVAKRLLSLDGRTTAVVATLKVDRSNPVATEEVMAYATKLRSEIQAEHLDLHIAITGSVRLSNSFATTAKRDLMTLFPAMVVLLTLVVYVLTRSVAGSFAALVVVVVSAALAMATSGWLGILLTPPSASTPTIVMTVAVADSIHILVTTLVGMFRGLSKKDAIVESIRVNWGPVFLTSATTAVGFLSLNFADAPPMHDLGTLSAAGAGYAWLLSITLFPALLAILPIEARPAIEGQARAMGMLANFVIRTSYVWLVVVSGAILYSVTLLPNLTFNDKFVEYFDKRVEFRTDSDWASDNLMGIYVIHYSVGADRSNGVYDPEYLSKLEELAQWMRTQANVVHVASFTDVMKRVNKSMHGDDESYYRVPDELAAGAQYLLLYEMSLPYGLDLNDQVNVDKSATRLTVTMDNVSTTQLETLTHDVDDWFEANAPEHMWAGPAGQTQMFAHIGRSNFEDMQVGTGIALVIISGLLMLSLRNIRLGIISLVPNLTPPLMAFGIYALFATDLGLWSAFIVATALGLIVDATVHFLSKYQRARIELGNNPPDAIRYAFTTVGTALWVSTLVLIAGFSVLAVSTFKINAMLGIMVANTVAVALVIDFLLLPALLLLFDRRDAPARAQ
jgi:hypothetical protein